MQRVERQLNLRGVENIAEHLDDVDDPTPAEIVSGCSLLAIPSARTTDRLWPHATPFPVRLGTSWDAGRVRARTERATAHPEESRRPGTDRG